MTNMSETLSDLQELNSRSREIFKQIVESYLATGTPVGSRNLSRQLPMSLSPASVRNVMSDLENLGLIYAPHTSAGRMPTEIGLRLFVDGMLEVGDIDTDERKKIESQLSGGSHDKAVDDVLLEISDVLSGLSSCAGVVLTDKKNNKLKHIEFVHLGDQKALVVMVGESGSVENRIVNLPSGLPPSALIEATNYLNHHIRNKSLDEARLVIEEMLAVQQAELDTLTQKLIKDGLAIWSGDGEESKSLIVRGRSHLLDDLTEMEDLSRIRMLFDDLETKRELMQLLSLTDQAEGVRIFIGSENKLFSLSGSSLIAAPFTDNEKKIVGVVGVIGPTRLNYARIIPMVDYTAKLVGRLLT